MLSARTRPIIFSGPMVRALLDGRKSQTRRVLKPQPRWDNGAIGIEDRRGRWIYAANTERGFAEDLHRSHFKMPYALGDWLWVREAWACVGRTTFDGGDYVGPGSLIVFRADFDAGGRDRRAWMRGQSRHQDGTAYQEPRRWRPAIHMPRWASRLTIDLTQVRVERLQDVSNTDAIAEGIRADMPEAVGNRGMPHSSPITFNEGRDYTAVAAYRRLWDSLNAKRGYGWDTNPWVVALTFNVVRANIDSVIVPDRHIERGATSAAPLTP